MNEKTLFVFVSYSFSRGGAKKHFFVIWTEPVRADVTPFIDDSFQTFSVTFQRHWLNFSSRYGPLIVESLSPSLTRSVAGNAQVEPQTRAWVVPWKFSWKLAVYYIIIMGVVWKWKHSFLRIYSFQYWIHVEQAR
jgi:hypothetical protein